MSAISIGVVTGVALGFAALVFGFWGFLLVAVLALAGGIVGALVSGRLDLRAAMDAALRRRAV